MPRNRKTASSVRARSSCASSVGTHDHSCEEAQQTTLIPSASLPSAPRRVKDERCQNRSLIIKLVTLACIGLCAVGTFLFLSTRAQLGANSFALFASTEINKPDPKTSANSFALFASVEEINKPVPKTPAQQREERLVEIAKGEVALPGAEHDPDEDDGKNSKKQQKRLVNGIAGGHEAEKPSCRWCLEFEVEPYHDLARCILAIFQKYAIFAQF
jgi:hypothetical protein